jgi:tetratricopeptide (TPR) repeat protein
MSEAAATYQEMLGLSPRGASLGTIGLADMALYEGRNADAIGILEKGISTDLAQSKQSSAAAIKLAALAAAQRDRGQAVVAANRSLATSRNETSAFPAARALLAAGQDAKALEVSKELGKRLEPEPRAYAKLLEGELQLAKGKAQTAIDLFQEARKLSDTWMGRLDLGRAYLDAGAFTEASSEFDACEKRKGEATSVFLDDVPSFRYYPQIYYYRARVQEGLKSPAAGASYKAFLAIKAKADPSDPLVTDARKRAKGLGVPGL